MYLTSKRAEIRIFAQKAHSMPLSGNTMTNDWSRGEEIPMTLQLVIAGTDGIVVASDTCIETLRVGHTLRFTDSGSKIVNSDSRFLYTFAGDDVSKDVGKVLAAHNWEQTPPSNESLEQLANGVLSEDGELFDWHQYRKVLLVEKQGPPFRVWVLRYDERQKKFQSSLCEPDGEGKCSVFAGDEHNCARYYVEHFYKRAEYPVKSVSNIKRLAAHVILTGSVFNPCGVNGLEMVVGTAGGFTEISKEEIKEMTAWSKRLRASSAELVY